MPLIKCDECGRKISDQSRFCPRCGHPTHLNKAYREIHGEDEVPAEATAPVKAEEHVETPQEVKEKLEEARRDDEIAVNVDDLDKAAILAETRRKNERVKTLIFILVTVLVLGLIIAVYFLTPKDNGVNDEVTEAESTEVEAAEGVNADTLTSVPEVTAEKPVEVKATPVERPAAKPAAVEAAPTEEATETREVTVAPLSEQAAPAQSEPAPVTTE